MPAAAEGPAGLEAWEERLWREGVSVVAGTDEAGRGPLAGPVVAAAFAVLAHDDEEVRALLASVADSKQMTAQQREEAYAELTDSRFKGRTVWAIAEAAVEEIDKANILQSSLAAMARSVQALEVRPDCVLVDGCNRPPGLLAPGEQWTRGSRKAEKDTGKQASLGKWFTARAPAKAAEEAAAAPPWRPRTVEAVIDGDARVPSISAASVLAKVHRDRIMEALHEQFPVYGFASHKGYGTEAHMEAIKLHGVCPHHRRSFGPIREALGLNDPMPEKPATLLRDMLARPDAGGREGAAPGETPPATGRAEAHLEATPRQGPSEVQPPATGQKVARKRAAAAAAAEQPEAKGEDRVVRRRMRAKGQDGTQA